KREPIFVFAHIVSPHPPFVFGENGERTDFPETYNFHDGSYLIRDGGLSRDEYVEGYRSQLVFVNSRIKDVLNAILSNAARKKIVILQSDHGPGSMLEWENPDNQDFRERMFILNAFYFPDGDYSRLYKDISPVNTFRAVFNQFFGTELPLLEDRSYFSTWGAPYRFYDVSEKIGTR
ncbi:MAG: hypothetical protein FJ088_08285, partial [Deltaproteobacteria bacterium]|nr:hypothetical protein [Deltaproteobacteria bacterium]